MSELLQMLADSANILVGAIVLLIFAILITGALFLLLAMRGAWRFLARRTWGDVVVSSHRKAIR